jgi:ribosomal protein S27E
VLTMTERPSEPQAHTATVRCQRCNRTLGLVAPGRYWLRHAGRTLLIEGLTDVQRIRVWCEGCNKENVVEAA